MIKQRYAEAVSEIPILMQEPVKTVSRVRSSQGISLQMKLGISKLVVNSVNQNQDFSYGFYYKNDYIH